MKVKVLIPFMDKVTKKQYKKGDIIDVSSSRFNEIIKKGALIEAVDTKTEDKK